MKGFSLGLALCLILMPARVLAQPSMDSLWPNPDGMRWEFEYHLIDIQQGEIDFTSPAFLAFEGTVMTPGGLAQVLIAQHELVPSLAGAGAPALPPLLRWIWRAREDLRGAIEERYADTERQSEWGPLYLHGGNFIKSSDSVIMWQDFSNHATWKYLESDITIGASFVIQLVPDLADDIFLHGTVAAITASVDTPAGVFADAVKMEYVIDMGVGTGTNENGDPIGLIHSEIRGHVHYVPNVGPVDMLQEFIPYIWIDCGEDDCPPEWVELLGVTVQTETLSLTQLPVRTLATTWGGVKSLYRR